MHTHRHTAYIYIPRRIHTHHARTELSNKCRQARGEGDNRTSDLTIQYVPCLAIQLRVSAIHFCLLPCDGRSRTNIRSGRRSLLRCADWLAMRGLRLDLVQAFSYATQLRRHGPYLHQDSASSGHLVLYLLGMQALHGAYAHSPLCLQGLAQCLCGGVPHPGLLLGVVHGVVYWCTGHYHEYLALGARCTTIITNGALVASSPCWGLQNGMETAFEGLKWVSVPGSTSRLVVCNLSSSLVATVSRAPQAPGHRNKLDGQKIAR